MLADIGITRSDLRDAFSEPFWDDPTALLRERAIERRLNRAARCARPGSTQPASIVRATDRPARQALLNYTQTADPSHRPLDPTTAIIPSRGRISAPAGPSGGRNLFRQRESALRRAIAPLR